METIGDAYMVASGVPVPNGNLHAMEVSMMSLDLLAKILTFEIQVPPNTGTVQCAWEHLMDNFAQHKPGSRLKLRMGMHSGRVVGGVVGTKIPHYSVFGWEFPLVFSMLWTP